MKKILFYWPLLLIITIVACNSRSKCKPIRKDIVDAVFASGHIITQGHYNVTAQSDGYLLKSFVQEGDTLFAQQKLFQLDSQNQMAIRKSSQANYEASAEQIDNNSHVLAQLEARLKQAHLKYITDSISYSRFQHLIHSNAISKADFEQAKLLAENAKQEWLYIQHQLADTKAALQLNATKAQSDLTVQNLNLQHQSIVGMEAGIVNRVYKTQGDWVRKGETLAEVGSGQFIAKLFIAEEDIEKICRGQKVFIELNTKRNYAYDAYISKVYPYFDAKEQSFVAEACFEQPILNLKTYTQLQANIIIAVKKQALVIPTRYVLNDSFVCCSTGTKSVSLGIKTGDWVEVLKGLNDDERLILPNKGAK